MRTSRALSLTARMTALAAGAAAALTLAAPPPTPPTRRCATSPRPRARSSVRP